MITTIEREEIAQSVLRKLGTRRAAEAARPCYPPIPNPHGFDGVDKSGNKYRARIRYCDALSGKDTRITLGRFATAEQAGFAYATAHIQLWGSHSRYLQG
jgi:hypothetical protein